MTEPSTPASPRRYNAPNSPLTGVKERENEPVSSPLINSTSFAPRNNYDDDSDDDLPTTTPHNGNKSSHRRISSSAALLAAPGSIPPSPRTKQRQRMLRSYSEDESSSGLWTGVKAFYQRNTGLLCIALAQAFFSVMNLCVKILVTEIAVPVWELIFVRMAITALGCVLYLQWSGDPHPFLGPPGVRGLLCIRGIVGFFGLFPVYYVLQYLSLSDATTISFLSPVLVGLFAWILLKEPYSRLEALVGCTSMFGTIFIAKPTFLFPPTTPTPGDPTDNVTPEQRTMAVLVALIGVCGAAGAYLIIRVIGHRATATHSILYFSTYSVIVACMYPIFFDSPPVFHLTARFFVLLVPIGVLGFVAQVLLTMGLQREKAGRGTLAVYTHLIFAMILERIFFHKLPDAWSLLGATIIVGGALKVALVKTKPSPAVAGAATNLSSTDSSALGSSALADDVETNETLAARRRKVDLEEGGGFDKFENGRNGAVHDESDEDDEGEDESGNKTSLLGRRRTGSLGVEAARGLNSER